MVYIGMRVGQSGAPTLCICRLTSSLGFAANDIPACMQVAGETNKDVELWKIEEAAKKKKVLDQVLHFKALQDEQIEDKRERYERVRSIPTCSPLPHLPKAVVFGGSGRCRR